MIRQMYLSKREKTLIRLRKWGRGGLWGAFVFVIDKQECCVKWLWRGGGRGNCAFLFA